jgi:Ca2+:H+ antiporter
LYNLLITYYIREIMNEGLNKIFYWMFIFIPISLYCAYFTQNDTLTFITAILAIIPLAALIGFATKDIVLQSSPTVGGLLNATFGNAIELIIAVMALSHGLIDVVRASIIGSIISNLLLLIGLSIFFGGLKYKEQTFNKMSAGVSSTMLIIAVAALAIPTFFALTTNTTPTQIQILSEVLAGVMAVIYLAGLFFSLYTHKHLFDASGEIKSSRDKPMLSKGRAMLILLSAVLAVAFVSEALVKTVEHAAVSMGMTQIFIGVVIIAIITNIAEKLTAIHFAREDKLDISIEIGSSSAIQIALFVVPILVIISSIFHYGFSLVFTAFEVITMLFAVMIINYLSADGKCNWLEGAQLIALYLIIAIVYFFI